METSILDDRKDLPAGGLYALATTGFQCALVTTDHFADGLHTSGNVLPPGRCRTIHVIEHLANVLQR